MWRELTTLWQSVRDPEYAHLLLESLPLYGLGFGLTFLVVALVAAEKKCRLLALAIICLSCATVWPYMDFRLKATPRILATRDPTYGPLIRAQNQLRQDTAWAYYGMAGLAAATFLLGATRHGKFLLLLTVTGGMAVFWLSVWLHKKECEIYHRNIVRYTPPG
jgi:hypothetical protein